MTLRGGGRRAYRRYPIVLEVEYAVSGRGGLLQVGRGRTLSLSSGGALVQPDQPIPPGAFKAQLTVHWPARHDGAAIKLVAHGHLGRREAGGAVWVAFWRHMFRTAASDAHPALSRIASSAGPAPVPQVKIQSGRPE
jgi:hypothetical protein